MDIIQNMDFAILDFIQDHICNPILDNIMIFITSMGDSGVIWIVIAIYLLLFKKYRKYGLLIIVALLINCLIVNVFMKNIVARTRPYDINNYVDILINKPKDYSFPSGHTSSSFVSAVILYYMNKKIGIFAILLASLIAFSRLYLYVHFPSDVFFGFIIGCIIAISTIGFYEEIKNKKRLKS